MVHKFDSEVPMISFITIATGRYLNYWKDQFNSAKIFLDKNKLIEFVILTDQVDTIELERESLLFDTNWTLKIAYVPHQEWPFPTLYKFKNITFYSDLFTGKIIWHLDADMLFSADKIESQLMQVSRYQEMVFVEHPGYFRSRGIDKYRLYLSSPALMFRDVKSLFIEGGVGTWERDEKSLAYVEIRRRGQYVCGGSWGGEREIVLNFSKELASRIDQDFNLGIVARFHDESHINWYRANHRCSVLDSSYCFEESYKNLRKLEKKIVAVNKNSSSKWER